MMSKRRPDDVSEETVKKCMTFSKAMIRLGAYATYSVIFLLKKLNKILCDSAKAFTSNTTALILKVIGKLKKIGRKLLVPFVACIRPIRKKFTAKRAETDMTLRSIRTTGLKQFFTRTVNYAVPAAAVVVFAVVLGSVSKIDRQISEVASPDASIDNSVLIDASDDLGYADSITENDEFFIQRTVEFEEPYEKLRSVIGTDDVNFIEAVGLYIDGSFIGSLMDESEIKALFDSRLEEAKSQPDVKEAAYKKSIEYRSGTYRTDSVITADDVTGYMNSGTDERRYIVEEGDSLTLIAEENGVTLEELLAMNPEVQDPDLCVIGTELIVAQNLDNMPIIITKEIKENTSIPFETQTVDSDSLYVGETEILIDGVNGEGISTVEVCYESDMEISRKVISTEVTKQPVAEMIAVGIRQREVVAVPASSSTILQGNGMFMWPVDGGYISDVYGSDRNHKGLDIAAAAGTSIYASAPGKVIAAGWNTGGYGYFVMIDHGNGYATLYGHMSKVIAENGAEVKCGDLIGEVGTTGDSTGNHLHFEVRYNNVCQNPANYINVNTSSDN
ncbi:MAG: M23 family metallopeptidase [Ruminococcus sp.]|nr:M23 family metallopeptidase [Ruminococcus sp.]